MRAMSDVTERPSMAICMAFMRALRMSVASISDASTHATDQAMARSFIKGNSISRFFSVSFLESFNSGRS